MIALEIFVEAFTAHGILIVVAIVCILLAAFLLKEPHEED